MSFSKSRISTKARLLPLVVCGVLAILILPLADAQDQSPSATPTPSESASSQATNTTSPLLSNSLEEANPASLITSNASDRTFALTTEPTPSTAPTNASAPSAKATNSTSAETNITNGTNNTNMGATGSTSSATPAALAMHNESNSIIVEGLILPQQKVELASPSEGLIKQILVPEGISVKEGQIIAQIDDREEQIQLKNAEFQASKLRDILASLERLFNEKVTSRMEYNKALLQMEQAEAERNLYALRMEKMTIKAPCDAYVLRLLKHPGESVQRLEKFAELVVTGQIHITSYVNAEHLGRIPVGTIASVSAGDGMAPVDGIVEVSDPVLDPGGKVFRIKVRIDHPTVGLVPGMRAQVEFHEKQ